MSLRPDPGRPGLAGWNTSWLLPRAWWGPGLPLPGSPRSTSSLDLCGAVLSETTKPTRSVLMLSRRDCVTSLSCVQQPAGVFPKREPPRAHLDMAVPRRSWPSWGSCPCCHCLQPHCQRGGVPCIMNTVFH